MPRTIEDLFWAGPIILSVLPISLAASLLAPAPIGPTQKGDERVPERLEIRGIENTFRLGPRLYSGGDPHGAEALAALKALGVRTIISVDGATPDVETARKLGLRYVHL